MEHRISDELRHFVESGIYRLDGAKAVFVDPVRLLNESYSRFSLSPSAYYSRRFDPPNPNPSPEKEQEEAQKTSSEPKKKRKRNPKAKQKRRVLNEREQMAEKRHQEARPMLLGAHRALLGAADLVKLLPKVTEREGSSDGRKGAPVLNFVELGCLWQAPLYDMSFCLQMPVDNVVDGQGLGNGHYDEKTVAPLFNNLINIKTNDDVEAWVQNNRYILPCRCSFLMSDLKQIRNLIPVNNSRGYNLIVIDPPWENGSAHQKAMYPTLPNNYLLFLPVRELADAEGALVALWITNREKLRMFVEKDLFPSWGVTNVTPCYWMKVKPNGALIGDLDLFHHRPYECVLLGYINASVDSESTMAFEFLKDSQVILSIPGAHSRKPPLGKLLSEYIPGPKPARCIELFARELVAGWTSWGNEPLHFQDSTYFLE